MFSLNVIVSLVNILFFVVVQTAFFWLVGARQLDKAVQEKASLLCATRRNLQAHGARDALKMLDTVVFTELDAYAEEADKQAKRREEANLNLVVRWIGPLILVLVGLLVAIIIFNRARKQSLGFEHYFGLVLVVVSYVTELMFFFFVVRQYNLMGDYEILHKVVKV